MNTWVTVNRVMLGLFMLIQGLLKVFVMGPDAVKGLLSGIVLFSWAPLFWAWVLIIFEIGSGLAIIANWKTKYTTIPPIIILIVAVLFVVVKWSNLGQTSWSTLLLHLVAISNFILIGVQSRKR
jgi:uncharacterized membrane protein YphA (DoxX/SURF4 family)